MLRDVMLRSCLSNAQNAGKANNAKENLNKGIANLNKRMRSNAIDMRHVYCAHALSVFKSWNKIKRDIVFSTELFV